MAKKPPNQTQIANARRRAREHFASAIERVASPDDAWRFVLSGPRGLEPGAEHWHRLSHFLKHGDVPDAVTADECAIYLALVRRFLKSTAIPESEGKRLIATIERAAKTAK